jgi:hypothetical protein
VSIIVTATDAATAASAVESLGGQVMGYLYVNRAVLATISAAQLDALAMQAGVRSITRSDQPNLVGEPVFYSTGG